MHQQPSYLRFEAPGSRVALDPRDPAFFADPYPAYAFLHQTAPTFFWQDYGFWCAAGYETVNWLLRDRRLGRENRWPSKDDRSRLADFDRVERWSLLEREPPVHTRLRTLVNRAFVSRQVERLRPRIALLARDLIAGFPRDEPFDLLKAFATPVPITVIAEMLGMPPDDGSRLVAWSNRMVAMYLHAPDEATERDANAAARDFAAYIMQQVARRRAEPGDDLLTHLIAAQDGATRLSEDEIVSSAILLLNAGHEATVHQTGNAVRSILRECGDPGRFFGSPEAAAATVEECLRIEAPLHLFTRFAYEPVEVCPDIVLQRGERVGLLLGAANRDPSAFTEPDRFRPDRPDQKNLSFGAGIHFCIGAPLARLEMQVALTELFRAKGRLALAEQPDFADSFHFHGLKRLMVTWSDH